MNAVLSFLLRHFFSDDQVSPENIINADKSVIMTRSSFPPKRRNKKGMRARNLLLLLRGKNCL